MKKTSITFDGSKDYYLLTTEDEETTAFIFVSKNTEGEVTNIEEDTEWEEQGKAVRLFREVQT